jgi:hypothetical protein
VGVFFSFLHTSLFLQTFLVGFVFGGGGGGGGVGGTTN